MLYPVFVSDHPEALLAPAYTPIGYAAYRFEKGRKQAVQRILEKGVSDLEGVDRQLERENRSKLIESVRKDSIAKSVFRTYGNAFERYGQKFGILVAEVVDEEEYLREYQEWEISLMEDSMEELLREAAYTENQELAEGY